jgi:O-antigen ligase
VADLVRLAGVLAMIVAVLDLKRAGERAMVLGAMGGVAVFETVVAALQLIRHAPVGLNAVGEFKDPFWLFGTASAPQGTIVHPYILAGLALVAGFSLAIATTRTRDRTLLLAAATAVAVAPLGFTYSRAGVLGFAIAVLILATGLFRGREMRARYLPAVVALCVGAAVPALVWNAGWVSRTKQSVTARSGSQLSTDRGRLIREANALIADHPIVGVGPGRYVIALRDKYHQPDKKVGVFKPVHNLPLLLTAEGGIPAGLAMTALLVVVGWQAFRSGKWAFALYVAYLPFTLLDHFPYSFPQGLIITGFWLAGLNLLAREGHGPAEPRAG